MRDEINRKSRERRLSGVERFRAKARMRYRILKAEGRLWYKNNREKNASAYSARRRERRRVDKIFALSCDIRSRIHRLVKRIGGRKNAKTMEIIGCTTEFLMEHIKTQFKPGMTWENHGSNTWHIDHIIPLAKASSVDELFALCHYSNLQPLWAPENIEKSDLMPEQYEARLKLRVI